jgi:TetR/AcrR family transcriptional repressor of nem operon
MGQGKPKRSDAKALHVEILKAVAPFVKEHGINAPVDQILKAAGLTSGALYSHFKNKEDLCNQVICSALDASLDRYRAILNERGRAGLMFIIDEYLSGPHVGAVAEGCPFAAFGADMAKAKASTKRLYQLRIQDLVGIFAEALGVGSEQQRRAKAQHMLAAMLGALTFARSMDDPDVVGEFLSQVRSSILRELD